MTNSVTSAINSMNYYTSKMEAENSKQTMGSDKLDKNSFLRLLMAQLKNQDPLKPMDNAQFLQQQATLTQVEELQNLNKSLSNANGLAQSSSLIGKTVTIQNPENYEEYLTGVVTAANINEHGASIELGGTSYPLDLIRRVQNTQQQ